MDGRHRRLRRNRTRLMRRLVRRPVDRRGSITFPHCHRVDPPPDPATAGTTLIGQVIPAAEAQWYVEGMNGTYAVVMGDRGRLVVPADVRLRAGLTAGTPLILLETDGGIVLLTRSQLRDRIRDELAGTDLVTQLLAERRADAAAEDAPWGVA
jgi:AbrB family looped-hinge helix DNA binding protein